jgi:SnoaL-like domain
MTIEERLAVVEATEAVRKLFSRYTWALDHGDVEAIVDCFAADGVFEFGEKWEGVDAVRHYFTEDREKHTAMLHYPVNVVVDVPEPDGSDSWPTTAQGQATLWDLFNRDYGEEGLEGTCLTGWYRMAARREAEGWRIAHLEVVVRWIVPVQKWHLMEEFQTSPELRP